MAKIPETENNKKTLLLLTDTLSSRLFFSSGIISNLYNDLDGKLDIVATFKIDSALDYSQWVSKDSGITVRSHETLREEVKYSAGQMIRKLVDETLEKAIGFFPLAVRFNNIYKFNIDRMSWRNTNPFLNKTKGWPFPKSKTLFNWMRSWYFGAKRFVDPAIAEHMKNNYNEIIISNLQFPVAQPYIRAAFKNNIPIIGHIASWDHPVGKGVAFPYCSQYIVQNNFMKDALTEYHNIDPNKIEVTGWAQMDVFHCKSSVDEYKNLLMAYNLNPDIPCVLVTGNTEKNAPYQENFLKCLVDWWSSTAGEKRFSIIFRPHPKDILSEARQKIYAQILNKPGIYVQRANYSDLNVLRILLQHTECIVTNAGTILLDSLANDRPVVCFIYDEGAPKGARNAENNVKGSHYKTLLESGAFYIAKDFDELKNMLEKSLSNPQKLAGKRKTATERLVGKLDGKAGSRVMDAIMSGIK